MQSLPTRISANQQWMELSPLHNTCLIVRCLVSLFQNFESYELALSINIVKRQYTRIIITEGFVDVKLEGFLL